MPPSPFGRNSQRNRMPRRKRGRITGAPKGQSPKNQLAPQPFGRKSSSPGSPRARVAAAPFVSGYPKNSDESPKTREREFLARLSAQLECEETATPSADCTSSKKSESVYTCPRAPLLYGDEGLLHTENTLSLREYS
jgi:hypothetical protein